VEVVMVVAKAKVEEVMQVVDIEKEIEVETVETEVETVETVETEVETEEETETTMALVQDLVLEIQEILFHKMKKMKK
jgi:uncharacterized protein (DUF3084 family)